MSNEAVLAAHNDLKRELRAHGLSDTGPLLDQIVRLPKKVIYRLSYEGLKAEAPDSASAFKEFLDGDEPTTVAGRQLAACVRDSADDLDALSPYELAKTFVLRYMGRIDPNIESIRLGLFINSQTDWSVASRNALNLVRLLWLTDEESPSAPANIKGRGFFETLDPLSIWAWWSRQLSTPFWLRRHGFDEVSRKAVDRGVDITAFKDRSAEAEEWAIQCKHWAGKVGPDVVRELEGARRLQGADRAMLMTSSAFTPSAIQTALDLGIDLVDGDQLHDRA
jgi:hypothetical protein